MARLACVELPELPLQLLYREQEAREQAPSSWRERPAVVLEADRATALVLFANEAARACGILPGMRYAAALSLSAGLEAGVVPPERLRKESLALAEILRAFSPSVEPSEAEPGIFWLDATGLLPLYPSLGDWARALVACVAREGLSARVVVGFSRMGSYALVRTGTPAVRILPDPEEERRRMRAAPLSRLGFAPKLREALTRLGVVSLGDFLALPGGGLRARFGEEAHRLHRLGSEELSGPLEPYRPPAPLILELELDHAETDRHRLLFSLKGRLDALLRELDARREALTSLSIELRLEDRSRSVLELRPAAPTLDGPQLADLLRLRLERVRLSPGVVGARLRVESLRPVIRQTLLFTDLTTPGDPSGAPRRDLEAATRALFRLRAELGEAAVAFPELASAHLPEGQVRWVRGGTLPLARPVSPVRPRLIRRFFPRALPLPGGRSPLRERAKVVGGPHLVSGGWWRQAVERHYHFVEGEEGQLLWVFYDSVRRRWRLQGRVD